MLMSAASWKTRLENEYEVMCNFPINTMFSWRIAPNQSVPHVKIYFVKYHVTTKVKQGGKLINQNTTEVKITMPENPGAAPAVHIIGGAIPFHPNIYTNGSFCLGDIGGNEPNIWKLVINLGRILAFDPARTNPNSPANGEAAADWKRKQSGIVKHYPCGKIDFPHPMGY